MGNSTEASAVQTMDAVGPPQMLFRCPGQSPYSHSNDSMPRTTALYNPRQVLELLPYKSNILASHS
jgi:hypothetical protein